MTLEQLKAFIAKVQGDTSLQGQLNAEGADVVAIAKAAGFTITTEDLNSHRHNLSDEELEGIAGGYLTGGGCGCTWTGRICTTCMMTDHTC
ncbi:lantipeptide precursor/ Nif11-like leader peptide domain protein [Synechococcus sp. BIOS-U3-1]|uniref:Nif11-like leader peptide family natural product precursor n=1 Tax=Synechococcus sp. BIOS-U3-1 TaxID=1400865 RepID=UPI001648DC2B|nr:Nif11-like leader peptide family natural product precursor [Synechococcus sp. BIOS-U3-1]QNI58122.1 lantipeptide precursor/ Nif11-like leader peptide domain protein [Synechococcus sp. BIOS-U3-1]|tara:strand:+ start:1398 stop:1670 length:273 start_codon:yes stop_codon:yes gene_type:complete